MKLDMSESVELPEGISATMQDNVITIKGPKGEIMRRMNSTRLNVNIEDKKITISITKGTKRDKTIMYTLVAHLTNMVKGVQKPWTYALKVCASHFPMSVAVSGSEFTVKNLFGEKVPRKMKIKEGVTVKVSGQNITVECIDIELAGQTAGAIEGLTRISGRDKRVFQDGIYITEKCGVKIE